MYLRALSLEPTSADTLVRHAVFQEVNGDFAGAERLLRQATGINQSHAMGLLNLAVLFETVKHDYANAEWYYKSAYQVWLVFVSFLCMYMYVLACECTSVYVYMYVNKWLFARLTHVLNVWMRLLCTYVYRCVFVQTHVADTCGIMHVYALACF